MGREEIVQKLTLTIPQNRNLIILDIFVFRLLVMKHQNN